MKRITINGAPCETSAQHIAALAAELGFVSGAVLIEHNGTALRPSEWNERVVNEGDRIELMRLAAGG